MKLFMRVLQGRPIDHPQSEYGMKILFPPTEYPEYDYINSIPPGYYPLEILEQPHINCFEKLTLTYEFLGDKVRDVWSVHQMNEKERAERLEELESIKPYPSWILNEITSDWEAPVLKPETGNYTWSEESKSWV